METLKRNYNKEIRKSKNVDELMETIEKYIMKDFFENDQLKKARNEIGRRKALITN